MGYKVFDIESNGLLPEMTKLHCINVIDEDTGKALAFNRGYYDDTGEKCTRDGTLDDGVELLEKSDIAGQNIIWFDIPAIRKIYPSFAPRGRVYDTKVVSQVIYTDLKDRDFAALRKGRLPHQFQKDGLIGKHSLEAWGWRLGEHKGYFEVEKGQDKWALFTENMDVYGRQDPVVTLKLKQLLDSKDYSAECLELEHIIAEIVFRQHERGFALDMDAVNDLVRTLQVRHAELSAELQTTFKPWRQSQGLFVPKRNDKKRGYVAGVPVERFKEVVFNPASRQHIADRLQELRGWKPTEFTPSGEPKVDETVLEALPYPEAKLLSEYLLVEKRLGQVANGKEAWLKHATDRGIYGGEPTGVMKVHGSVTTNGAVTGRMTHSRPNVAQTPKAEKHVPYGKECRSCWTVSDAVNLALVGCDAEGLELRCLAHYMAKWDGGSYGEAVINGNKEEGTDVHSLNRAAAGLNSRDNAKTFVYALLYGAGDFKLGTIVYEDFTDLQKQQFLERHKTQRERDKALAQLGKKRRARLMDQLPAFGKLVEAVKKAAKRGHLKGLDGRLLHIRSDHAALNTLLQSAGAIVMKKALVMFEQEWAVPKRSLGVTVAYVANVHDEVQMEVSKSHAEEAGKAFADCIRRAGEHFGFRCPLAGSYAVGTNWAETH